MTRVLDHLAGPWGVTEALRRDRRAQRGVARPGSPAGVREVRPHRGRRLLQGRDEPRAATDAVSSAPARAQARWVAWVTVPGLSELAARHTELTSADLDRLGLLLADWQLIADLAFSDLVLWLPTWNASGYVAAAHATSRPPVRRSSPTTWSAPSSRAGGAPSSTRRWPRAESSRSRRGHAVGPGRGIPVPSAGRVMAVIAQHTDPSVDRARSPLEETYVDVADRLAGMVAEGDVPVAWGGARPRGLAAGRRRAAAARRRGRRRPTRAPTPCRPTVGSGWRPTWSARSLAQTSRFLSPPRGPVDAGPVRDPAGPYGGQHRDRGEGRSGRSADASSARRPAPDGRAGAAARRQRPSAARARARHQGRDDPGDPPPGEEQPADRGRAAAAAGPSAGCARRGGRAGRGRAPGAVDRPGARDCSR